MKHLRVKAMVMAAGAGTRLRPLTHGVPKPMVPIANRPVLEYTLENLKRHGITEIMLNLHNHPTLIRNHFKDGAAWGVQIQYSHEPKLLGTAGGVRKAYPFLQGGTFVVMSGDGLTDIDLTNLLSFHRQRHSPATMALKKVDLRFDYGVTLTGSGGRIRQFVEKPQWRDVFSNQVNTGIYVFEPAVFRQIAAGRVVDFGHDVWPRLLSRKEPIYGYLTDRYWCDVGNLSEYRRAQRDFLEGKVGFRLPGQEIRRGVWLEEGVHIHAGVKLEPPCLIGRGSQLNRGVSIGSYTVIGSGARIGANSRLTNCTLWDHVQVGEGVRLDNCIIGHNAHVTESISMYEGSVIQAL
jgi:mannose-1-phosphate guanylyltransferase / phosphomannomutase